MGYYLPPLRGLQPVQHVNQLAQAAVIAAVEPEGDAREVQVVLVFDFLRRRRDDFNGLAGDDVGEVFVDRGQRGRNIFMPKFKPGPSAAAGVWVLVFMMNGVRGRRQKSVTVSVMTPSTYRLPARLRVLNEPNLTRPMAVTNSGRPAAGFQAADGIGLALRDTGICRICSASMARFGEREHSPRTENTPAQIIEQPRLLQNPARPA